MKRFTFFLCLVLCLALTLPAWAGDLKNEDSKPHDIKKIEGASTTSTTIASNTTLSSFCSDCTIELVSSGQKIEMGSGDTVVIKDGEMKLQ